MRKKLKKAAKFVLEHQNYSREKKDNPETINKKPNNIGRIYKVSGIKHALFRIKKLRFLKSEKKSKFIAISVLLCIILCFFAPKGAFFVAALIAVSISRVFQRFCPFEIGIELITFFTACFAIAYGPLTGAIFGFFSMLTAMIVSDEIRKKWSFIPLIAIVPIALVAGFFPYEKYISFAVFGFLLALVYDCLFDFIFRIVLGRMNIFKRGIFYITHLYFNYLIFLYAGEKALEFFLSV